MQSKPEYQDSQIRFMPQDKAATRNMTWRAAYNTLSMIIQDRLEEGAFKEPTYAYDALLEIQDGYHKVVVARNKFPPANSTTPRVEEWIFQITANWKAIMHAAWSDEYLQASGKLEFSNKLVEVSTQQISTQFTNFSSIVPLTRYHSCLRRPQAYAFNRADYIAI